MNTCPEHIVDSMHAYLDGDISRDEEQQLKDHLACCASCKELMDGLNESILLIEAAKPIEAPAGFVEGVMKRLPKEKSEVGFQRWFRRHPVLTAAAMFLLLMSASLVSSFGNDQQFSVTKQPNLVIDGEKVVVPKGEVINGDIVVKNGDLHVEGEVIGNITVINGSKYMASTAIVTGTSEEIDRVFDWLWYKIKTTVKSILPSSEKMDEPDN